MNPAAANQVLPAIEMPSHIEPPAGASEVGERIVQRH
jgi:hypothetical protein